MKFEKPIMEIIKFNSIDVVTASGGVAGEVPSDGTNEDVNQLPEVW